MTGKTGRDGLPVLAVADMAAWDGWLAANGSSSPGVWVRIAKKGSGRSSVSYQEAVETSLRHGWIDGQRNSYDEQYYIQRFTRRGPRSAWSQVNVRTVERLSREGRMLPAGMAEVERAKGSGAWDRAYAPASEMGVPDDLKVALEVSPAATKAFADLSRTRRYSLLLGIERAKRAETRARRIAGLVTMLEDGTA